MRAKVLAAHNSLCIVLTVVTAHIARALQAQAMKSLTSLPSTPLPLSESPPRQKSPINHASLLSPPPITERVSASGPPASVLDALALFRSHRDGRALAEWTQLRLAPAEFDELLERIARDRELKAYVENKIRYDYIPTYSELIIRMPTYVHESLIVKVAAEFQRQIDSAVAQHPSTSALGQLLREIEHAGSSDVIEPPNKGGKASRHWRSPDASFRCRGTRYPGVVIEASYSQRVKNLRRVADDYVMMSDGNVRMVLGLDIGYVAKKGEEPIDRILVWEPVFKMEEVPVLVSECTIEKTFRGPNVRTLDPSADALNIPLCAFAPRRTLDRHGVPESQYHQTIVSIPLATLASFLSAAQAEYELSRVSGDVDLLPSGGVKRPLSVSSAEELVEEDEREWKRLEKKTKMTSDRNDGDWEG